MKTEHTWNHRVMAREYNSEVYLEIYEVYYTNDIPDSYTLNPITLGSDDLKGLKWTVNRIKECLNKPILWYGDKFPNIYEEMKT